MVVIGLLDVWLLLWGRSSLIALGATRVEVSIKNNSNRKIISVIPATL